MNKSKQLTNIKLLAFDNPSKSIKAVKQFDIKNLGKQRGTEIFRDGLAKSHLTNRYEVINQFLYHYHHSIKDGTAGYKYRAKKYFKSAKNLSQLTTSPWVHSDGKNHFQTPQRIDVNNLVYNTRKQFHLSHSLRASWNIRKPQHKVQIHPWHVKHHVNLAPLAHVKLGANPKFNNHPSKKQVKVVKTHGYERK